MLIEIHNSIISILKEENEQKSDKVEKLLIDLAIAHKNGDHIILGDSQVLHYLSIHVNFGKIIKSIYASRFKKKLDYIPLIKTFKKRIILVDDEYMKTNDNNNYYISIQSNISFQKTVFICEDLSDCEIYKYISNWTKKYIPEFSNFKISLENRSCGGSQAKIHCKEEHKNMRYILLLLDTDRGYQNDKCSSSYHSGHTYYKNNKSDKVVGFIDVGYRNLENIFSPKEYLKIKSLNKYQSQILDLINQELDKGNPNICKYFKYRDGYKVKNVIEISNNSISFKMFFKDLYNKGFLKNIYLDENDRFIELSDPNLICLNGLGKLIHLVERENILGNIESKTELNLDFFNQWKEITKELFDWGCSYPKTAINILI
ncbi:hypothetical protein HF295_07220 [Hujiaoplasma nucleasis]|uniref:Uncharacterized protein n=1 Tax=Hujiaoplasma nucleasis TaxID=2725268 RepID=A0A7L6N6M6_9MOLU|nr:hypothetical protein [Hujiaoplasma nucleasis]QLY40645.1 hypothetical protein HF295_07220 [Hujiaoplasma nucleasis]